MNSFSRREAKKAVLPQVPVADGDSGRGESDQDTGSFEGKDPVARDTSHAPTELSNSVVVMDIPDAGSMGPLCTNICRQYGHEYNPDTSYTMPRYYANGSYNSTPSHQYPHDNYTTTSLSHSASDLFHDGMYPAHVTSGAYYVASPASCHHGNSDYVMTSRVASPTTVQSQDAALKRRSTASLHGELLHRRFIAAAQNGSSRADNLHSRAQTPAECGEVSMEETQQIIDDIDQLIDH
uniref:Uncharacterized protein n=1 Tax=Ciona savignyi TaxID=51511 RepID=H2YWB2_CIOSA